MAVLRQIAHLGHPVESTRDLVTEKEYMKQLAGRV